MAIMGTVEMCEEFVFKECDFMENWQFFLQKEGDDAWLPLETLQVEILEGRYQLIAHTQRCGATVRVDIQHLQDIEQMTQQQEQHLTLQVDDAGKVCIFPALYLGLGSWNISCYWSHPETNTINSSDLGSSTIVTQENCQNEERYTLEIQVLSQDFDIFEEWEFVESQRQPVTPLEALSPLKHQPIVIEEFLIPTALAGTEDFISQATSHPIPEVEAEVPPELNPEVISANDLEAPLTQSPSLPVLPKNSPRLTFRTVEPKQLPLPISDTMPLAPLAEALDLPSFTKGKSVTMFNRQQRQQTLNRMKIIAIAMGAEVRPISPQTAKSRFHSTLTQLASPSVRKLN